MGDSGGEEAVKKDVVYRRRCLLLAFVLVDRPRTW